MKHDPLQQFLNVITDAAQRLVADKSPEALAEHVTDARNSLPLLVGETGPLIDVGTGAGFPGVPLLIDRPEL
ncbi:MAG: class I SAM-dependent methyltransferase, partial [Actinobacteria bacterium]|nr:class I SAM-dependent methyltransferase [Actinomycetota bacterium]